MRTGNHASPIKGISKIKSQGSAVKSRKTLRSQTHFRTVKQFSAKHLPVNHGRLMHAQEAVRIYRLGVMIPSPKSHHTSQRLTRTPVDIEHSRCAVGTRVSQRHIRRWSRAASHKQAQSA